MTSFVREVLERQNEVDAATFLVRFWRAVRIVLAERRAGRKP